MAISKEKKKTIDAIMRKINKQFGNNATSYLSNRLEDLRIKFFKTPSYMVNTALYGGVAKGKIVEFFGQNSSGKTGLALEIIGKTMKEDKDFMAAWLETEGSLDPEYIKMFGIDPDRFIVITQSEELPAEKCMDILRGLINSKQFGIIVLNSVAGLLPTKEVEDNLDKQNIALTARILSKFLRITTTSLDITNTTLILINQLRQNLNANSAYSCNTTTGGMAIPFYATQRIEMKKEYIKAGDVIGQDEGVKIRCRVIKNRVATGNPYKVCNYYALYGQGIDGISELSSVLVQEGILSQHVSWLKYEDDKENVLKVPSEKGDIEGKWNGATKFTQFLRENPSTVTFFEKKLNEKIVNGTAGADASIEEIDELNKINDNINSSQKEIAATDNTNK